MLGNKLTGRVAALEKRVAAMSSPAVWIIRSAQESKAEARARYEAEHGTIGDRFVFMWSPHQGDKLCA